MSDSADLIEIVFRNMKEMIRINEGRATAEDCIEFLEKLIERLEKE